MIRVAAFLALVALAGCASTPAAWTPPKLPEQVLVPVPEKCPAPVLPARPALPIAAIRPGAAPAVVAKAYAESVQALIDYAKALEVLLQGYGPTLPHPEPQP